MKTKEELLQAITYIHFSCHKLCKQLLGQCFPVAGNIGVFCHDEDEYKFLTDLRKQMTDEKDNWNQKYFRLHSPIVIPKKDDIPQATYTYLYIRQPDPHHPEVGDLDFCMDKTEYAKLKNSLQSGKQMQGVQILDRSDLDLIALSDPSANALAFVGDTMTAEHAKKTSKEVSMRPHLT